MSDTNESAEALLTQAGVFKGVQGLRGLLDASAFWERQPYGTRLYYGDGGSDYLQRGVLDTAVKLLDAYAAQVAAPVLYAVSTSLRSWYTHDKAEADAARFSGANVQEIRTPAPLARAAEQHPDDIAVDAFAAAMKAKLAEARANGRGGWQDKDDCPQQRLSDMLHAHVEKGDPRDVANFCMFLHQRGEGILPRSRTMLELAADPALRCDTAVAAQPRACDVMALEDVRDWHRGCEQAANADGHTREADVHRELADAIDAAIEERKAAQLVTREDAEQFLVQYHRAVWDAACDEDSHVAYDEAGEKLAQAFLARFAETSQPQTSTGLRAALERVCPPAQIAVRPVIAGVVYDGPSLAMLQLPDGRFLRLQQLGGGRETWSTPDDNDALCIAIASVTNGVKAVQPASADATGAQVSASAAAPVTEAPRAEWTFATKAFEQASKLYPESRHFRDLYQYGAMWAYRELATVAAPSEGLAVVPRRMFLDPQALASIGFLGGAPDNGASMESSEAWSGVTLWVGETVDDDGNKHWGLNAASSEYPEEGSLPVCEFARASGHAPAMPVLKLVGVISDSWPASGFGYGHTIQCDDRLPHGTKLYLATQEAGLRDVVTAAPSSGPSRTLDPAAGASQ